MTTWPTRIIDHPDRMVAALPWPLLAAPRVVALVRAVGAQIQQLEDVAWDLVYERQLPSAVGAQLQVWGELLDEPQGELTVQEWRHFLRAKLQIPRTACRPEEITATLRVVTGNHGPAHIYLYPPARVGLAYFADAPLSASHRARVRLWMERMVTGGVAIEHIIEKPLGGFGLSVEDDPLLTGLDDGLLGVAI